MRSVDYLDALDTALATLEVINASDPGSGVQYMCAETARALIQGLSNIEASGTAEGPLRRIAGLYEAVTGEPGLKAHMRRRARSCKS